MPNELEKATSLYEEMGSAPVTYGARVNTADPSMPIINQQFTGMGGRAPSGDQSADTWRYGSPADVRKATYGGATGGTMAAAAMTPAQYKPVEFQAPGDLKLPEYKPPERDEAEERGFRREYMGPGMAQIRRSTQEAIISSKSFDNPNARALFIRDALKGVGEGVEKVAGGAAREARAESTRRYSEDIANYVNKWNAKAQEATAKYDSQWKSAMVNFQEQQMAAQSATITGATGGGAAAVGDFATRTGEWWKTGPTQ